VNIPFPSYYDLMEVTDLEGKTRRLTLIGYTKTAAKSSLHLQCRSLLQELYPTCSVIEELLIPINSKTNLYLDFFIPLFRIAVEVQGPQHYEKSSFFHKDIFAFAKQKQNDMSKQEFCTINNIELIKLKYDESDKWRDLLT
jgi:hypothetical protein